MDSPLILPLAKSVDQQIPELLRDNVETLQQNTGGKHHKSLGRPNLDVLYPEET